MKGEEYVKWTATNFKDTEELMLESAAVLWDKIYKTGEIKMATSWVVSKIIVWK